MFDLSERPWELPTHVPFAAQGKWPAVAAPTPAPDDLDMLRLRGERSGNRVVWQHAFAEQAVAGQACMQTSRRRGLCCHTTSSQLAGWVRMLGPLAVWSWLVSLARSGAAATSKQRLCCRWSCADPCQRRACRLWPGAQHGSAV